MKIHICLVIVILVVLHPTAQTTSFVKKIASLRKEKEIALPLIVQYIDQYSIKTNDLEDALNDQLKNIKLGEIKTSYARVQNTTVSISHYSSQKKVQSISPFKVKVTNDSFSLFVIFSVHVVHIVGGKNYTCNTSIPLVYLSYTKELDVETGNLNIANVKSTYSSKAFTLPLCKETQSGKDKVRIDQAVNATQGSSIYIELLKKFNQIPDYFSANAKKEHLSKIYQTNPYMYNYQGTYNIPINVGTVDIKIFGDNGVQNRISGAIQGTSKDGVEPPQYQDGYSSFYSKQLFQNILEYTQKNYVKWQNLKLNGQNMRSRIFKFRLIDFEPIIPAVLQKFPQKYLSDVLFICNIQLLRQFKLTEDQLSQFIDWRCMGSFESAPDKRQTFINFVVLMKHIFKVNIDTSRFLVYINKLEPQGLNFEIIGEYQVVDPYLVGEHIKQILFEFTGYTIGTNMKIKSPQQMMKIIPNKGIWIA